MTLRLAVISISFAGTALFALPVTSVLAHTIEVTGDVAGTWHIEPNHTPKAGESATVWVALTRKGGIILPLEQANCQLGVYDIPRRQGDQPVLQPPLQAIAIEQYQGIPGAEIVFPKTGLYRLELSCTPKVKEGFIPFQMAYEITVVSGSTSPAPTKESPQPKTATPSSTVITSSKPPPQPSQSNPSPLVWIIGAIAATVSLMLVVLKMTKRK